MIDLSFGQLIFKCKSKLIEVLRKHSAAFESITFSSSIYPSDKLLIDSAMLNFSCRALGHHKRRCEEASHGAPGSRATRRVDFRRLGS